MPLYEYECTVCHRLTEKRQKFSDPELTECPFCGGKLERTISAPAFQFAGGGWYKDLYSSPQKSGGDKAASDAKPAASGSSESSGSASSGTESKSSESKPASAPAAASSTSTSTPSSTK